MILYVENLKETIGELLELLRELNKLSGPKFICKYSSHFCTSTLNLKGLSLIIVQKYKVSRNKELYQKIIKL